MYLLDLAKIAKKNWETFGAVFQGVLRVRGKAQCEKWFVKLNRLRNRVAHPLRGDLSDAERDYLMECDRQVSSLTARLDQLEFDKS